MSTQLLYSHTNIQQAGEGALLTHRNAGNLHNLSGIYSASRRPLYCCMQVYQEQQGFLISHQIVAKV